MHSTYTVWEVDASELFANESVDWQYCLKYASFQHQDDDACEFMLHVGDVLEHHVAVLDQMTRFGCTKEFMQLYREAMAGGYRLLHLYV